MKIGDHKIRSGFHKPTRAIRSKKVYDRAREKQQERRG